MKPLGLLGERRQQVRIAARVGIAIVAMAIAMTVSSLARVVTVVTPFMFFQAAVPVVGWALGFWAQVGALAIAAAFTNYYLLGEGRTWALGPGDLLATLSFMVVQLLIAWLLVALRRAERKAATALAAREEFIAVAGHELRTPLTSLRLQYDLIRKSMPPEPALRKRLDACARQLQRLAQLVDAVLDVGRLAHRRFQLEPEQVDLVPLVREVIDSCQEDARRAGCTVELTAPPALEGRFDPMRVQQALANVVANAIKYGLGKPVEVELGADASGARIVVRDHGMGISAEDLPRIFGRFERAVPVENFGGMGLGLYVTRQLVEAMGGKISAQSVKGQGSTFTLDLPAIPLDAER